MSAAAMQSARAAMSHHALAVGDLELAGRWKERSVRGWQSVARQYPDIRTPLAEEAGEATVGNIRGVPQFGTLTLNNELVALPVDLEQHLTMSSLFDVTVVEGRGGSADVADELLRMAALLPPCRCRITVQKSACSAHAVLVSCWHGHRRAVQGATLVFHPPAQVVYGDPRRLRSAAMDLEDETRKLTLAITKRSGRTVREVSRWLRAGTDVHFTAEQALDAGLVDEIVEDGAT